MRSRREPFYGFRVWRVRRGHLYSVTPWGRGLWPADHPKEAYCPKTLLLFSSHTAPGEGCSCGIYARKSPPEDLGSTALRREYYGRNAVWGVVELSGKVIEHADGFRAQFARPVALVLDRDSLEPILESYELTRIRSLQDWMT